MKNLKLCNIFKHLKTTLLGLLFITIPTFVLIKHGEINIYLGGALYVFGGLLLVSPDNVATLFLGFVKSLIGKVVGSSSPDKNQSL